MLVLEAGYDAVEEGWRGHEGEGGVHESVESFVGALIPVNVSWGCLSKVEGCYLSDFETIVDFVFEGTHLHFADERGIELRLFNDER